MELRHLRYFVAVADEEHITKAAERLGIQQPPLSHQIKQLEDELGVELLERKPRKIALNDAGKVFAEDAKAILNMVNAAVEKVRNFKPGQVGSLLIGLTSSASMHEKSIGIIDEYRTKNVGVNLRIVSGANHDLLKLTEEGRLDFAFVRSNLDNYPSLKGFKICDEQMVLAFPSDAYLHFRKVESVEFKDLNDLPFVVYRESQGFGIYHLLLKACEASGFEPSIAATTDRMMSAIQMVAAGYGICVVPRSVRAFTPPGVEYKALTGGNSFTTPLNVAFNSRNSTLHHQYFHGTCLKHSSLSADN
jgi:DNA-binding transcriptional LysR family regulator